MGGCSVAPSPNVEMPMPDSTIVVQAVDDATGLGWGGARTVSTDRLLRQADTPRRPQPMDPPTTRQEAMMQRITPCLWYDTQAEEAANYYVSIFPNSRIVKIARFGDAGPGPKGGVMVVEFELDGQRFQALNGGPIFHFTEAVSLSVACKTQEEVDRYWNALSRGGEESQCGWLKDKYGLSWQVIPTVLGELLADPDPAKARRAMEAMLKMKKIDIAALERA
jgi:predicted 3-demethylubiquinone-9 3-methyltransferase (glyoxalase superfamily)